MTFSPTSRQIVLQEVFDEASVPTDEEIHDYALKIGINIENEPHLLYLARDGLMEALPAAWKPCYDEDRKEIYYFNFKTGKAQWEHPLDEVYRNLVKKARTENVLTTDGVDDDSRTSIKEDLKSFEEASIILPSSEMYPKPKVLEPLSPLGLGTFRKSPTTALAPMKKSCSRELLKGSILKLPMETDEDLPLTKNLENDSNMSKKLTFDETEVRKRPNSSDIRNRRNIGPVEFRHLSKQEIIVPKHFGKSSFLLESKKLSELAKLNDLQNIENKTVESIGVIKDEGYGTEFSVSSLGDRENEMKGNTSKKELTLVGGGSVFLKTNKNKFSPSSDLGSLTLSKEEFSDGFASSLDGRKSCSEIDSHSRGILREQKSLNKTNEDGMSGLKTASQKYLEEDRKSVRFNLDDESENLKINFEIPEGYHSESEDNESSLSKIPKSASLKSNSPKSESSEKAKQIEIDFEELEINFTDSLVGSGRKPVTPVEEPKALMGIEMKAVKPKKFKSSQALVQEFREIFEVKNKTKINIPISSPLHDEENNAEVFPEKHSQKPIESDEKNAAEIGEELQHSDKEKTNSNSDKVILPAKDAKPSLNNLIDLSELDEIKDSSSVVESQRDSGRTDQSYRLKDEIFDSDFAGLVDFALKRKMFEESAASNKSDSSKDLPIPRPRRSFKERNLLEEILKLDEGEATPLDKSDDRIVRESSLNSKSDTDTLERKSEEMSGKYEKRKNEKLKSLEANFNEWLSETEKSFEEKKSNALIKMKEKYEDWIASRETEFAKMYSEKKEEETQNKFKELKNEFLKREQEEMEKLKEHLEIERSEKLSYLKTEHENELEKEIGKLRKMMEERLKEEREHLMQKHREEVKKMEINLQEILSEKQSQKVREMEIVRQGETSIESLQLELKESYQNQKLNLVREHELLLDSLRQQHLVALEELRAEFKNEEEDLRKFHSSRLKDISTKLNAVAAKKFNAIDNQKPDIGDSRTYEKVRCEKRLLEDKYKTLKEKYIRLKSEAKSTLERKPKKEVITGSETERSSSHKSSSLFRKKDCDSSNAKRNQQNDKKLKSKKPLANLDNFNQNISTEEEENMVSSKNTSSLLSPTEVKKVKKSPEALRKDKKKDDEKHVTVRDNIRDDTRGEGSESSPDDGLKKNHANETKKRRQLFSRLKAASTSRINSQNRSQEKESFKLSPVENLRRQLKKLEELEDQFPLTTHTDTYMRYPFTDIPQVGSSEIEFFKHRIHLERESVRRAKESLKSQKKSFENRQRELKQKLLEGGADAQTVMEQIYQEERDLTDMEVSVHRTRALLGEKIIRLRHLEQSLKRISEPKKKDSFLNKDLLGRLGFRSQAKEDDRTLSDLSSHSGSSGFSSTDFNVTDTHSAANRGWNKGNGDESRRQFHNNMQESTEIIQSLENLNSEIREIWEVLKKQHQSGQQSGALLPPPPLIYGDGGWPSFTLTPPMPFRNTVITSSSNVERSVAQQLKNQVTRGNPNFGHVTTIVDSSLVDRTKSLRDWLRAARNSSATSEVISPNQVTL